MQYCSHRNNAVLSVQAGWCCSHVFLLEIRRQLFSFEYLSTLIDVRLRS